jgi:hypothetical protein
MHLFTKNNSTQTLLTTHEVQTANKTLIQIQHAKCRIHSENVGTGNAVTMSYGPAFITSIPHRGTTTCSIIARGRASSTVTPVF